MSRTVPVFCESRNIQGIPLVTITKQQHLSLHTRLHDLNQGLGLGPVQALSFGLQSSYTLETLQDVDNSTTCDIFNIDLPCHAGD